MKWHREQYLDLMTFRRVDRPMFVELFGPLIGLEEEWREQGASEDELNLSAFDWDYVVNVLCGGRTRAMATTSVVLEESATHRVERDYLGRTVRLDKRTATIGLPENFPVKTMDDWLKLKHHFVFREERLDWAAVEQARSAREQGAIVNASIPGGFDMARELMGEEVACMAYYDQPELIHDILDTFKDTAFRTLGPISEKLQIDQLSVHEDFAGRSGPLVGPSQIDEFIGPYYRAVWDMLESRGAKIFQIDSDGNVNPVIDALVRAGFTSLYPMEPAAGMDIVAVRKKYPRLMMLGGIDKHVLRRTKAEIRKELEYKMQPLMRQGGAVFGLDHRIPNGTPLENYRYYVKTAREILGLPPLRPEDRGWRRMAF